MVIMAVIPHVQGAFCHVPPLYDVKRGMTFLGRVTVAPTRSADTEKSPKTCHPNCCNG